MPRSSLHTPRLTLVRQSVEEALAAVDRLTPEERRQVSPVWLARVRTSTPDDLWTLGFSIQLRDSGEAVGSCGFKGPPDDGVVEMAYGIHPEHENHGFATEAAQALAAFACQRAGVRTVRAHTIEPANASTRVLLKCGFTPVGSVIDPEDGQVWRWERRCDQVAGGDA